MRALNNFTSSTTAFPCTPSESNQGQRCCRFDSHGSSLLDCSRFHLLSFDAARRSSAFQCLVHSSRHLERSTRRLKAWNYKIAQALRMQRGNVVAVPSENAQHLLGGLRRFGVERPPMLERAITGTCPPPNSHVSTRRSACPRHAYRGFRSSAPVQIASTRSRRCSLLVGPVPMCGIHALAGACLLRHGVIEERLWCRSVRPGVRRKLHSRSHCQFMLFSSCWPRVV